MKTKKPEIKVTYVQAEGISEEEEQEKVNKALISYLKRSIKVLILSHKYSL